MKLYTNTAIDNFVENYLNRAKNSELYVLEDGSLASYGLAILTSDNYRTIIFKEHYINCWSSATSVRFYKTTPKKYLKMIENKLDENL